MAGIFRLVVLNINEFLNIINRTLIRNVLPIRSTTEILQQTFPIKYPSNTIIGQLNINYVKSKVELFSFFIGGTVDILLLSETKIDDTFPTSQFLLMYIS